MDPMLYKNRPPVDEGTDDLPLFGWPEAAPTNGSATSKAAAEGLTPEMLDTRAQSILRELRTHFHPDGATRQELQGSMGQTGDWMRPGVWTLRNEGWLTYRDADGRELPEDGPEAVTRPTRSGRAATVLFLSAKYWRAVEAYRARKEAA